MKIVFVNRFFYPDHSATSQLLTDLAFHLAKTGSEVHVVTSRQLYGNPDSVLSSIENICGVRVTRVWTTRFGRQNLLGRTVDYLTFYLSAAWNLFVLLRPGDFSVAKTDPPLISVVTAIVGKIRGAKLVNWIQDLFPEIALALDVKGVMVIGGPLKMMRNFSLRVANCNVVLGSRMAQRLIVEGVGESRIRVIHNWADGRAIQPVGQEKNSLRREWGLEGKFVVGYSGNFGRAHEFGTILSMVEILRELKSVMFVFIGEGAQLAWLTKEVEREKFPNVLFKPYQPRERLSMSLSVPDIHLVSLQPRMEGLIVPSKFYGVAAAGRPVLYIGDSDGEIPRILRQARCGYAVGVSCAGEAAHLIRILSINEEECRILGRRAREVFDRDFDKARALHAWKTILTSKFD